MMMMMMVLLKDQYKRPIFGAAGGSNPQSALFFWKRVLKFEIYPCGGTYIYIDKLSEEALPPLP